MLTVKQEKFVQNILNGMTQRQAYKDAYNAGNMKDETTLKEAKNLKFVAQTATGTNNVDFAYTNAHGIGVANVPSYSTDSVAQHTFSLLSRAKKIFS